MKASLIHHGALNFLYLYVIKAVYSSKTADSSSLLNSLLGRHSAKSLVVYLNLGSKPRSDFDDLFNDVGDDDGLLDSDADEYKGGRNRQGHDHKHGGLLHSNDAYFLYHLLKDVLDADHSSSSSEDGLGPTKDILRSALRSRCRKVESCVQECPPRKPDCPGNCQQVFDNLNLCPPPPPDPCAKKPRCGRTMPPKWRF